MKKFYLSVAAVLFLGLLNASAQGVPAAYAGDFNRMMANQNQAWAMHMSMNRLMNMTWYNGMQYHQNFQYDYTVTMKDSTVKTVKSKIYADTVKHKSYLVYVDKSKKRSDPDREQKIYADQTAKISRMQINIEKDYPVYGIATDSCWLFKVMPGKLSGYSSLSEVLDINESYLTAYQLDNGKVMKLDSAGLDPIFKTVPKAYELFTKKKLFRAMNKYNSDNKK